MKDELTVGEGRGMGAVGGSPEATAISFIRYVSPRADLENINS